VVAVTGRPQAPAPLGRKRITTRTELEHVAFELFGRQGFEGTTVDDIAAAAGIGRRTFFRYFPSKNDVPWGDFEAELDRMRAWLDGCPAGTPLMDAIRLAIVDFNTVPPGDEEWHRRRMRLILGVPVLQAHSTLRYAGWRQVIADFAAGRTGERACALIPQTIAWASLGVAIAAYEQWLLTEDADLTALLDAGMRGLARAFAAAAPLTAAPLPAGPLPPGRHQADDDQTAQELAPRAGVTEF
jgi:TetR/AcrR family transcriptional regulator, regulator of mycofactocin system